MSRPPAPRSNTTELDRQSETAMSGIPSWLKSSTAIETTESRWAMLPAADQVPRAVAKKQHERPIVVPYDQIWNAVPVRVDGDNRARVMAQHWLGEGLLEATVWLD